MPLLYSGVSDSYDSKDVHSCNGKSVGISRIITHSYMSKLTFIKKALICQNLHV